MYDDSPLLQDVSHSLWNSQGKVPSTGTFHPTIHRTSLPYLLPGLTFILEMSKALYHRALHCSMAADVVEYPNNMPSIRFEVLCIRNLDHFVELCHELFQYPITSLFAVFVHLLCMLMYCWVTLLHACVLFICQLQISTVFIDEIRNRNS